MFYSFLFGLLSMATLYAAISNNLAWTRNTGSIIVSLLAFLLYDYFSSGEIREDKLLAVITGILYVNSLLLVCVIFHRSSLNLEFRQDKKYLMNNVEYLLFKKYNIEFFVLGLGFLITFLTIIFASNYNFTFQTLVNLLASGLISVLMLYVTVSNSLILTKIICVIFICLNTPLALLEIILEGESSIFYVKEIEKGRNNYIFNAIEEILWLILINVIIYRNYLNIKFKEGEETHNKKDVNDAHKDTD